MSLKLARYAWALPNTLLGLSLFPLALVSKSKLAVVDGVLEMHGGAISFILARCVPLPGGASAMTLGHVVIGRDRESLDATRRHERVHVRQCEVWGPAFIPAYLACGLWAMMTGRSAYEDNYFERAALAEEYSPRPW